MTNLYSQIVLKHLGLAHSELNHYIESTFTQSVFDSEILYKVNQSTKKESYDFENLKKEIKGELQTQEIPSSLKNKINRSLSFLENFEFHYSHLPSNEELKHLKKLCEIADEVETFHKKRLAKIFEGKNLSLNGIKFEKLFTLESICYTLRSEGNISKRYITKFAKLIGEQNKLNQSVLKLKENIKNDKINHQYQDLYTSFYDLKDDLKRYLSRDGSLGIWYFKEHLNQSYLNQNKSFYLKSSEYEDIFQFEFLCFPFMAYSDFYLNGFELPEGTPNSIKKYLEGIHPLHQDHFSKFPYKIIYALNFLIATEYGLGSNHFNDSKIFSLYNPDWSKLYSEDEFDIIGLLTKKLIYLDLYFYEAVSRTQSFTKLSIKKLLVRYYNFVNSENDNIVIFWGIQIPRPLGKIFIECFIALLEYRQNSKESWFKQYNKEYFEITNNEKEEYQRNNSYYIKGNNISKNEINKEKDKSKSADLDVKKYYFPYKLYWDTKKNGDIKTVFYVLEDKDHVKIDIPYMEIATIDLLIERVFVFKNIPSPVEQNQISLPYNTDITTIRYFLYRIRDLYYTKVPKEYFAQIMRDNFNNHYKKFDLTYDSLILIAKNLHQKPKKRRISPPDLI